MEPTVQLNRTIPKNKPDIIIRDNKPGKCMLTFKNRVSYIQNGRTATLQMFHFIYFSNKYKY
jgi:hypothetical protein